MENTSLLYVLIESRKTILDLLERRGYDTTQYRKFTGPDLMKFVNTPEALRMILPHKEIADKQVAVDYVFANIKLAVGSGHFVESLLRTEEEATKSKQTYISGVDPKTTEVVILYVGKETAEDKEKASPYDRAALEAWMKHKLRIQFFPMNRLVMNPLAHELQPKFEIVPPEQHRALLKEWYCLNENQSEAANKAKFPAIKFHNDMAARCLGLVPLDIVKITASSPTAGEYVKYRVCVP
jgi:DNA-directed RNA polymerase subunit H (RpoH/RPB5)